MPDRLAMKFTNAFFAQSEDKGALPQLYAATAPGVEGGLLIGPDGFRRLWEVSEELTGVRYELGTPANP